MNAAPCNNEYCLNEAEDHRAFCARCRAWLPQPLRMRLQRLWKYRLYKGRDHEDWPEAVQQCRAALIRMNAIFTESDLPNPAAIRKAIS